ncbi:MAG: efflux RND transporter periplasmic adaptor subunit [Deltaproteobacteria bacterium]|nr:efflux RND transporter periplasmic adaptor subunit [Deltaproteobacteria bacterium]
MNVSPERQQLVGIRTATAEIRPLVKKVRTVGIVTYDETKVAQVFTKVEGWIDKLFVNYTGKLVQKSQPLFTLYSPDLVSTQEEYLLALQAKDALASSSLQEIRLGSASLLEATRRRLSLWDISDEQIEELQKSGEPRKTLTIFSPLNGFVIKKEAFQGMKVMPDKELYTIADLSTVWVNADIYEFELPYVRVGQKAAISLSYFPGHSFTGRVSWISPPDEAVLDSGLRKVVFLDKGEGRFEPREIKLGSKFDAYYEVLSGLSPGERILASASFLLDSESRLKEAMGAMAGMPGMEKEGTKAEQAKGEQTTGRPAGRKSSAPHAGATH